MPEIGAAVGRKIRSLRRAKNLSLEDLAEAAGLSLTYTGDIERGKKDPSLKTLLKLSRALGVPPSSLVAALDDLGQAVSKAELTQLLQAYLRDHYSQEQVAQLIAFIQGPYLGTEGGSI